MPDPAAGKASLHEHAVQAEEHLEQLATGLAQAGADPETVDVVSKMAGVTRKLVKALGKGQEVTGDAEPPERQPEPQPRQTMDSAAAGVAADMQRSAQQRPAY
jgi:hypothetical protein